MDLRIYNGRKRFFQYDMDQKFLILNENVSELHYYTEEHPKVVARQVYELEGKRVCDVPNYLFETNGTLTVYTFCNTDGEWTKSKHLFEIVERQKPEDYVVEEELEKWSSLDERVTKLEENGAGNGVASWNDLQDRPFYDEEVIKTIVEETTYVIPFSMNSGEYQGQFEADLGELPLNAGEKYIVVIDGVEYESTCLKEGDAFGFMVSHSGNMATDIYDEDFVCLIVYLPNSVQIMLGYHFALKYEQKDATLNIEIKQRTGEVKCLDEKFIPSTIARKSDLDGISVNQEDVRNAIETYMTENPIEIPSEYVTETELEEAMANVPTGSGGMSVSYDEEQEAIIFSGSTGGESASGSSTKWELIKSITTTEEVAKILINQDENGNSFSLKEIMILATVVGTETNTVDDELRIGVNVENDTNYRILVGQQGVRKSSTQVRTTLLKGEIVNKMLLGYYVLPQSDDSFTSGSPTNGNLAIIRMPRGLTNEPIEFDDIHLVEMYPKTSGCVFGVGTKFQLWGVKA